MRKITIIPGKQSSRPAKIKVCAYVRVSTDSVEQMNSLQNQTEYYERLLSSNPVYEFCGIYSDAGISGAKEERPGFQAMLSLARAGEIELIYTKSISRFARDIVTLLKSVRDLKDAGVAVIFQKENINTLSSDGELMLTVLGAIAEEERKSVRSNMEWALKNRLKRGEPIYNISHLLGYEKNNEGNFVINPEEAKIVCWIFKRYLEGISSKNIAKELNDAGIPGYKGKPWLEERIIRMIQNEKYCGDFLARKTYADDKGNIKKNRGEVDQYFILDHHPAIINRTEWEAAQDLRKNKLPTYPFTRLLKCPHCGASLVHYENRRKWVYWICNTQNEYTKQACNGINVPERKLLEINKVTPIIEPMVVVEVKPDESSKKRPKKDYRLIPVAEYFAAGHYQK